MDVSQGHLEYWRNMSLIQFIRIQVNLIHFDMILVKSLAHNWNSCSQIHHEIKEAIREYIHRLYSHFLVISVQSVSFSFRTLLKISSDGK